MYTDRNFRTKKDLKAAVLAGDVSVYQPGVSSSEVRDGMGSVEGPHFPEPHRFYARVTVKSGVIPKGSKVS
jgi:hypothetical protein